MGKISRLFLWLPVLVMTFGMCGCKPQTPEFNLDGTNGTTCANITMGNGRFAYRDGLLYMASPYGIYEYDVQTEDSIFLSGEIPAFSVSLIVTENHIGYLDYDGSIKAVTKDGKKTETIRKIDGGCTYFYIDGTTAYYEKNDNLYCQDLNNKKGNTITLVENIVNYYVSDDKIYAIVEDNGNYMAVYSGKDSISFNKIELSFDPVAVLASGEDIYFSQYETFQVICLADGQEIALPISSIYYQILDGYVIYLDEETYNNSCFTAKSYHLASGKETILCENVFDFCVLDNRYIAFWTWETVGERWAVYDWQTGKMKRIDPSET